MNLQQQKCDCRCILFLGLFVGLVMASEPTEEASNFNQDIDKKKVNSESNNIAWDTANVTNMNGMFNKSSKFNSDIGSWNVSKVDNMQNMFLEAHDFNKDLSEWKVKKGLMFFSPGVLHIFSDTPLDQYAVGISSAEKAARLKKHPDWDGDGQPGCLNGAESCKT